METLLVRLKPYDPRRGHILRRYTYCGIKVHEERGWHRVGKDVAEYLRSVRQIAGDANSALAFDVCTDEEAQAVDAREEADSKVRRQATDELRIATPRIETLHEAKAAEAKVAKKG